MSASIQSRLYGIRYFGWILALAALLLGVRPALADDNPEQLVRSKTDSIMQLIKQHRREYTQDHKKLYAMVDKEVLPYFDFERMSQWVLGRYWRSANEDQRARFIKEFRDLLVRTYATALLNYNDQQVLFLPSLGKPSEDHMKVRTQIKQTTGAPNIPIDYSFYKSPQGWRVYDVTIEGVSLVTNYRATYAEKIRRDGLDALIASMARTPTQNLMNKQVQAGQK